MTKRPSAKAGGPRAGLELEALLGSASHQQKRSRKNAMAIIAATRLRLKEVEFDELTVSEIAAQAGTSVGGFYARFASKSALLEAIMGAVMLEANSALDAFLEEIKGKDAATVVHLWTTMMAQVFREHEAEVRQTLRHLPVGPDPDSPMAHRLATLRDRARGVFRSELAARAAEIPHSDADRRIGLALMIGTVGLREAIIGRALPGFGVDMDDGELAHQMATCMTRYLGLA